MADVRRGIWKQPRAAHGRTAAGGADVPPVRLRVDRVAERRVLDADDRGLQARAHPSSLAVLRRASALRDHGAGGSTATHGGEGARHRDPRMTLRVYTDVTNMRPRTRLGGLLSESDWAPLGTNPDKGQIRHNGPTLANRRRSPKPACLQRFRRTGATGLEPAASGVTGRRSNQLSYAPEGARRRGRRRYAG
jgi:hypothetical protein